MPIYEYTCKSCQKTFDHLARTMSSESTAVAVKCPECGSAKTQRALSVFAVGAADQRAGAPSAGPGCGRCGGPGPCSMD